MTSEKPTRLKQSGIGTLPHDPIDRLRLKLQNSLTQIHSPESLKGVYGTAANREKVIQRLMLETIHGVVRDIFFTGPDIEELPDGSVNVDASDRPRVDALSTLFAAIRGFSHDTELLNKGIKAQLVLSPIDEEDCQKPESISADRKLVILALIFVETRNPSVTEAKQLDIASKYTGINAKSLRTYVRNMRTAIDAYKQNSPRGELAFSKVECEHYRSSMANLKEISGSEDQSMIATLIEPCLKILGENHQAIKPKKPMQG
jgi:hypothetical protein